MGRNSRKSKLDEFKLNTMTVSVNTEYRYSNLHYKFRYLKLTPNSELDRNRAGFDQRRQARQTDIMNEAKTK